MIHIHTSGGNCIKIGFPGKLILTCVAIWRPQRGQAWSSKGNQMAASASPRLDMCTAPPQTAEMNMSHVLSPCMRLGSRNLCATQTWNNRCSASFFPNSSLKTPSASVRPSFLFSQPKSVRPSVSSTLIKLISTKLHNQEVTLVSRVINRPKSNNCPSSPSRVALTKIRVRTERVQVNQIPSSDV